MKQEILERLTTLHQRLVQEGKLEANRETELGEATVYSNAARNFFSFKLSGIEVTVLSGRIDEISFAGYDEWMRFSWSNWFEDLEVQVQ